MIVWGVDVDSRALHFGAWDTTDENHACWTWRWRPKAEKGPWAGSDDLLRMAERLDEGWTLCSDRWHPDLIVVERPTGRHPSPALLATWGAALLWFKRHEHLTRCPVGDVAVSEWKKAVVGHGNATKEQVQAWGIEHTAAPFCALDATMELDQFDALAIGRWACELELEAA